jgi:hypothetical protein
VHDVIDEVVVGPNPSPDDDRVIMTTWHAGTPLAEAMTFVLNDSMPVEALESGCDSTLGIAIGNPEWHAEIRSDFRDPKGYIWPD